MSEAELRRAYLRLLISAQAFVKLFNEFPDQPEIYGQAYDDLWTVVEYCKAEEYGFTGIACDMPKSEDMTPLMHLGASMAERGGEVPVIDRNPLRFWRNPDGAAHTQQAKSQIEEPKQSVGDEVEAEQSESA
jgi:hypothetical protein